MSKIIDGVEYSDELLDPGEIQRSGKPGDLPATKPQGFLRKHPKMMDLVKAGANAGQISDLGGKHKVTLHWNLNETANKDHVFKMIIDEKVVYLDLDELTYYTRLMFN
jgi:hypothetical protein